MKKLVIVPFMTMSGNRYLYDDQTGMVFPSSGLLEEGLALCTEKSYEEAFQELGQKHDLARAWTACSFIRKWDENYEAFYRKAQERSSISARMFDFSIEDLQKSIMANIMQLVLILTENCNLRCRYCIYSDSYPLTRTQTAKVMPFEIARRAVDYFFSLARPLTLRIPGKKLAITFYGGEPLLAPGLLKGIVQYARATAPCDVVFNVTTNGTLLREEIISFLVENNVNVAVSLDGPESEHDRNRVFADGAGSFQSVWHNIQKFMQCSAQSRGRSMFVGVYDWQTDIRRVARFFEENATRLPPAGFVNPVADISTNYYQRFTSKDRLQFAESEQALIHEYVQAKIEDRPISAYTRAYVEGGLGAGVVLRRRRDDKRPDFLPFTSTCTPGMKIAVRCDGTLDICERVNGTLPVGHIDTRLDYEVIREIIRKYNRSICADCFECPITKMCGLCYALTKDLTRNNLNNSR